MVEEKSLGHLYETHVESFQNVEKLKTVWPPSIEIRQFLDLPLEASFPSLMNSGQFGDTMLLISLAKDCCRRKNEELAEKEQRSKANNEKTREENDILLERLRSPSKRLAFTDGEVIESSFGFSDDRITIDEVKEVLETWDPKDLSNFEELDLSNNRLSDTSANTLLAICDRLPKLRIVNLSGNRFVRMGWVFVQQLLSRSTIEYVVICNTPLTLASSLQENLPFIIEWNLCKLIWLPESMFQERKCVRQFTKFLDIVEKAHEKFYSPGTIHFPPELSQRVRELESSKNDSSIAIIQDETYLVIDALKPKQPSERVLKLDDPSNEERIKGLKHHCIAITLAANSKNARVDCHPKMAWDPSSKIKKNFWAVSYEYRVCREEGRPTKLIPLLETI